MKNILKDEVFSRNAGTGTRAKRGTEKQEKPVRDGRWTRKLVHPKGHSRAVEAMSDGPG